METVLVKKPEDREILDLIDAECLYYEPRSVSRMCTAPPGHKCPYRQYGKQLPTTPSATLPLRGRRMSRSLTPLPVTNNNPRSRPGSSK